MGSEISTSPVPKLGCWIFQFSGPFRWGPKAWLVNPVMFFTGSTYTTLKPDTHKSSIWAFQVLKLQKWRSPHVVYFYQLSGTACTQQLVETLFGAVLTFFISDVLVISCQKREKHLKNEWGKFFPKKDKRAELDLRLPKTFMESIRVKVWASFKEQLKHCFSDDFSRWKITKNI